MELRRDAVLEEELAELMRAWANLEAAERKLVVQLARAFACREVGALSACPSAE